MSKVEIPVEGPVCEKGSDKNNMGQVTTPDQVSKTVVEDLIKRLTIDEMNSKWVDQIFAKVKSELAENRSRHTPPSSGASSPISHNSKLSSTPRGLAYQATVEDVPEEDTTTTLSQNYPSQRSNVDMSPAPSLASDSISSNQPSMPKPVLVTGTRASSTSNKTPHSVRFRDRGPVILHSPSRSSPVELADRHSTVDQIWGKLFDKRGDPTERLGQLLRGIANYIIAEYSPANSLVLTPEKLHSFYAKYKVDSEILPYQQIFDCRPRFALDNLELLYQQFRCEHHLIQGGPSSRPYIPSLTPTGFEHWMILQIAAFPEQEAERLGRIVADLPIIADGERLPKQLSRHLFPEARNPVAYDLVLDVMTTWIRNAEYDDLTYRKSYRDDTYKPRSSREDSGRRHRSDESRYGSSSKHRRRSGDNQRSSSKIEDSSHESSPTIKHQTCSPSTTTVDTPDEYLVTSDPRTHRRREREKGYRMYQGRSSTEMTPRTTSRDEPRGGQEVYYEENVRTPRGRAHGGYSNGQEWHV